MLRLNSRTRLSVVAGELEIRPAQGVVPDLDIRLVSELVNDLRIFQDLGRNERQLSVVFEHIEGAVVENL